MIFTDTLQQTLLPASSETNLLKCQAKCLGLKFLYWSQSIDRHSKRMEKGELTHTSFSPLTVISNLFLSTLNNVLS